MNRSILRYQTQTTKPVELSQIFLFNYCYCKIADFDPRKGRFTRKKWKDVQSDGSFILLSNPEIPEGSPGAGGEVLV